MKLIAGHHELRRLNTKAIQEHRTRVLSDLGLQAARKAGEWALLPVALAHEAPDNVRLVIVINDQQDLVTLDVSPSEYAGLLEMET